MPQLPDEFDWPGYSQTLCDYLTSEEVALLGLDRIKQYRNPASDSTDELHKTIHNDLVNRRDDFKATRAAERAAYDELKQLVEESAPE